MTLDVEIILIGNELLIGKIQDSNGLWLIHQLLPFGIRVTRITTIPDNIPIIADAIRDALTRKPGYIFTSGGLGPTFDDMTLAGVAQGLTPPRKCLEHPAAIEMIRERYLTRFAKPMELTPNRRKMGTLPEGSLPLTNREGTAPGVLLPPDMTNQITTIVCLPGVPHELQAIFTDHLLPKFRNLAAEGHFYEAGFIFQDIGESKFTELISQIKDEYPDIWIKTHPRGKEKAEVELHLTTFSPKPTIQAQMQELYRRLRDHVMMNNGILLEEHPPQ
jgi:molybdenum cofactor synthesis domain-containing protein